MKLEHPLEAFDWITPLFGLISDRLTTGQDFVVTCALGDPHIRRILKRNGIKGWGFETINDKVMFRVAQKDAERTDLALRDEGI